jgi:RNA methyltransferase, TrmH family
MKPIGKDHESIQDLRRHRAKGTTPNLLVCDELGILEKYVGAKQRDMRLLKTLIVCEELLTTAYATAIFKALESSAGDVFAVSPKTYELVAEKKNSGGLLGVFGYQEPTPEDFFKCGYKRIIVMDGLENPGNVGTILRSADAAGFDAVLAVDLRTRINGDKCVASSRGMVFELPILSTDFKTASRFLTENGYTVYLGEPEDGVRFDQIVYADQCTMVVGSERFGINPEWFFGPHERVYIPMAGSMTSLNVGVAASLLMYEVYKQKR